MTGNKIEYELNDQAREKMKLKKMGARNSNYGKPRAEIVKQKISQAQKNAWQRRKVTSQCKDKEHCNDWTMYQFQNEVIALARRIDDNKHKTVVLNEEAFDEFLLYLHEEVIKSRSKKCTY